MPESETSTCEDREAAAPAIAPPPEPLAKAHHTSNTDSEPHYHHHDREPNHHNVNGGSSNQQEKPASPPVDLFHTTTSPAAPPPNSTSVRILDRRGSCWSLELGGLESPSPTSLLSKLTASNSPPAPPAVDNQVAFAVRPASTTVSNGQREAESYFINWQNWQLRKSGSSSEHSRRKSLSSAVSNTLRRGSSFLDDISPVTFSNNSPTSVASSSTVSLASASTQITTPGTFGCGRNPTLFLLSPTTLFPASSSTTALAEMAHSGFMASTNLHGQALPRVVNMRLQLPPNALSAAAASSSSSTGNNTHSQHPHHNHHNHHHTHSNVQHSFPSYMCTPDRDASEPSMENLLHNGRGVGGAGGSGVNGGQDTETSSTGTNNSSTNCSKRLSSQSGKQQLDNSMALLTPPEETSLVWKSKDVATLTTMESIDTRTSEGECSNSDGGNETPTQCSTNPSSTNSAEGSSSEKSVSVNGEGERPGLETCGNGSGSGRTDSSESASSDKTVKDTTPNNNDTPEVQKWLSDALEKMFEPGMPVQGTSEAVRVLSFTTPCPISLGDPNPESSMYLRQQDRLPASAQSAPAVAAAANRQLSPIVVARCSTRASQPSTQSFRGPEPTGIITAAYDLVTSIQERFADESHKAYVQVFHAISPLFPLNRVAGTPPPTYGAPGRSAAGEIPGYFSPSVFNSIVMAHAPTSNPSSPHPSPNPILPPTSIHYTLFERYIPPATAEEDRNLFSGNNSILLDRICELSERNGSLLFIYPTKAGAKTFLDNYLGPVLDPLLRKYMVLYRLRDSLLWKIRHMAAAEQLRPFEQLEDELKRFCHGKAKIVYSERKTVQLEDVAWREWWVEQEAERIRACFKSHTSMPLPTRRATHTSVGSPEVESRENGFIQGYGAPGDLAREILDSVRIVARRPSSSNTKGMGEAVFASSVGIEGGLGATVGSKYQKHVEGIEVGVFVLRKDTTVRTEDN